MDIKYDYREDYRGGIWEYFRESKVIRWTQEWSRVVSAEVKEEYMTLQVIQTH